MSSDKVRNIFLVYPYLRPRLRQEIGCSFWLADSKVLICTNNTEGTAMNALAQLKLTNTRKPTQQPAIIQQRTKLAKRIWEQMELAKAQQAGDTFTSKRLKTVVGTDGVKRTVEVAKRVKPWWFVADTGKLCVNIRYGSRVMELAKDKTAIEISDTAELVSTLGIVKSAVMAGALDAQIAAVSGQLRSGFKR